MKVKVKRLEDIAVLPTYATDGSGCFDISTAESHILNLYKPTKVFHTGLSFEIPKDHVMLVFSRSGHGFKDNVRLSNCVGVIDSDYRGELLVKLKNDSFVEKEIEAGDRIAQGLIIPIPKVEFEEVEELSTTERGQNGFGSTGT